MKWFRNKGMQLSVAHVQRFVFPYFVEFHLQLIQLFLQVIEGILHQIVGVVLVCLNFHFDAVFKGMGLSVACELDVFVLEKIDAEEIANGVVFKGNAVGDRVDHFLFFDDFDVFLVELFLVESTDFEAVILIHG